MIHCFINPHAGRGRGRLLIERWRGRGAVVIEPERLDSQLSRAEPGDALIIAGGDGTVSMIVDRLFTLGVGDGLCLAVVPLGTGNDLARSLGWNARDDASTSVWARLESGSSPLREVAVWRAGGRHFLAYLSLGLDAQVLITADGWRHHFPGNAVLRQASFGVAGLRHVFYRMSPGSRVVTEYETIDLSGAKGLILGNLGFYLGGCRLGPHAPEASQLSLARLDSNMSLIRLALGRYLGLDAPMETRQTASVRLEGEQLPVQIDGESVVLDTCEVRCVGRATFLSMG